MFGAVLDDASGAAQPWNGTFEDSKGLSLGAGAVKYFPSDKGVGAVKGQIPITDPHGDVVATIYFASSNREQMQVSAKILLTDGSQYAQFERKASPALSGTECTATQVIVRGKLYAQIDNVFDAGSLDTQLALTREDGSGGITTLGRSAVQKLLESPAGTRRKIERGAPLRHGVTRPSRC